MLARVWAVAAFCATLAGAQDLGTGRDMLFSNPGAELPDVYVSESVLFVQESADEASLGTALQLGGGSFGPQRWPQLWRYRTRVTIAHFAQKFATSAAPEVRAECTAIQAFVGSGSGCIILSAMHHLPDILQLQRALRARLEHRISKEDASAASLQGALDSFWTSDADQRQKGVLLRCARSFVAAWAALAPVINTSVGALLQLDGDALAQRLSLESPLHYFVQNTTGPGKVGVAMTSCLLDHHNALVRKLSAVGEEPVVVSASSVCHEHLICPAAGATTRGPCVIWPSPLYFV